MEKLEKEEKRDKPKRVAQPGKVLGRPIEWTEEKLHELGKELMDHVNEDGVYHLSSFCVKKMKTSSWMTDMTEYPIFSLYHSLAKKILGNKLFRLSMEANPNNWVLKTYMPRYLSEESLAYEDIQRETMAKLQAAKDSGVLEPDHPFWDKLMDYMGDPQAFKRRGRDKVEPK